MLQDNPEHSTCDAHGPAADSHDDIITPDSRRQLRRASNLEDGALARRDGTHFKARERVLPDEEYDGVIRRTPLA
jgi:hypothetical protein